MSKETKHLFCNTNYKVLLQLLRADTSKSKTFYGTIHPREWIPPPCLTSAAQDDKKREDKIKKYLDTSFSSSDEMDQVDHCDRSKKTTRKKESPSVEGRDEITHKLKHLKKDKEVLKDTYSKLQSGDGLSTLDDILHKWRVFDDKKSSKNIEVSPLKSASESVDERLQPSTKLNSVDTRRTEVALQDLERSFRQAKEEEERLKSKLKRLKKEDKKSKENKRPVVKLKKSSGQSDYKILAMKRRYEDLLQYLARVERKNKELKKENEVLHATLKEENEFPARDRIFVLEQEILNRNKEVENFSEQLNGLKSIRNENIELKKLVEELKMLGKEHERERHQKEEDFEREWVKKATDMKLLYERAIQGYKEQLSGARTAYDSLEQRFRTLIQYYEREIKNLKSELTDSKASVGKEQETIGLLKLETLLEKKDKEICALKESLKEVGAAQEETSEQFQKKVLEKLSEIVNKSAAVDENCLESIRGAVKEAFEHLSINQKRNSATPEKQEHLLKENESLKQKLQENMAELIDLRRNWEKLTSRNRENAEKMVERKNDVDVEVLREFPRLLKDNETKLKNSEENSLKFQLEVKLLQERLKNASADLQTKKSRITELEDRIKELSISTKKMERENEKLESKIEALEVQIGKKNRILEKNSVQIEERIREYQSLVSQTERMREEHAKESADLKSSYQGRQMEPKLQEAQAMNVRLQSQVSTLRSEKDLEVKMAKKQIRDLEEQMTRLKIKNTTLQKHLQTIQDTYKSMFGLEVPNMVPFLTFPNGFPNRETQLEANGRHAK